MEEKWTKKLPFLISLYAAMFIVWGDKCKFKFDMYGVAFLIIMYVFFSFVYLDTYKMTINDEGIKVESLFRRTLDIPIDKIYKMGIENHPYQIAKVYILFVYTSDQVYQLSTHLFIKKELNAYLSKLCQEKGIEYYFNK